MSVLFCANILIHDNKEYEKYLAEVDEVFRKFNGEYIAVDKNPTILEGNWNYERFVIIKFPNEREFNNWYNSPEYRHILKFRLSGAKCDSILVKDLSETEYKFSETDSSDKDFQCLTKKLDEELWSYYPSEQGEYDVLNKIAENNHTVVVYYKDEPIGCGCIKKISDICYEVKRVFIDKEHRGSGLSKKIMKSLEDKAFELGAVELILETGKKQTPAINLYKKIGYVVTENYGEYAGKENSICMKKCL